MGAFFLLTEVLLVAFGLIAVMKLTNVWWAILAAAVLGVVAMERVQAAHREGLLHERIRAVAKKHLPGGRT
jgi:hypothetical protein